MFIRCSSLGIKNPVGYMNLKFRKKVRFGAINLGVISKKVVFRVISLDEIIKGVTVDREQNNNQVLRHVSIKKYERSWWTNKGLKKRPNREDETKSVCSGSQEKTIFQGECWFVTNTANKSDKDWELAVTFSVWSWVTFLKAVLEV